MNCSKCNATIPDGTSFCPKCGTALSASTPVSEGNTQKLSFWQKLFQRRLARKDYWLLVLFQLILFGMIYGIAFSVFILLLQNGALYLIFHIAFEIIQFFVFLFLEIERLHDTDRSGWNICWGFLPLIGFLIVLVMLCLPGTEGANRFGNPPQRIF